MVKKYLIRFFIGFSIAVLLLLGTGVIITLVYGDEIKQYFISKLNNYLNTEIKVGEVEFSVLSKFPNASIDFTDVVAMSAPGFQSKAFKGINTDTLLVAKDVFLEFNILDIFSKNYKIKAININKGRSWIFIDNKGGDNYHFWKSVEESDSSEFKLDLQNIELTDFKVFFHNLAQNQQIVCSTPSFSITGKFNDEKYELKTKGDLKVKKFIIDEVNYINSDELSLHMSFNVDNNKFNVKSGRINVGKLAFDVFGSYSYDDSNINMQIKGKNLDVVSFLSILPKNIQNTLSGFSSSGTFYFDTSIEGKFDYNLTPEIITSFGIEHAKIVQQSSGVELNDVYAKGNFTNGELKSTRTSRLSLDTIYASMGQSRFSGSYFIKNFNSPFIQLKISGDFDLQQLKKFFDIDTLKVLEGHMKADFSFSGNVASLSEITAKDYRKAKSVGKVYLKNTKMKFEGSKDEYSHVNAGFTFRNNDVRIDSLSLNYNETDLDVSGYFKNLIAYIMLDDEPLFIEARIHSKYIDLKKLFTGDSEENAPGFALPENIKLSANVSIDKLDYGKFTAQRASGFIDIDKKVLTFTSVNLEALQGTIKADGALKVLPDNGILLQTTSNFKTIDIKKLFVSFDNFGQTFILDKHLKGTLNADITVSSQWTSKMELDQEKLTATCSMQINNGELADFEPMYELSKYIALSELKQIKFASLTNDILIKDRKVIIPHMEIKSSAFNIELSGEHSFDNEIDYKLKVLLSEILSAKAKKAKKENEEFGQEEDDGLGRTSLFLSIKGTTDKYKISYDTKQVKEHIKENLKIEKETLKTILNEEFGWFKNDSALIKKQQKKEEIKKPKFLIEWDEESPEEDRSK